MTIQTLEERPASLMRGWGRHGHVPVVPLLLAFAAGTGFALQAFANGRLGASVGSPQLAALVNNVVGLIVLVIVGLASRALVRAARRARAGLVRLRWWHLLAAANGAIVVLVGAVAAPEVGVALVTVAFVCGQTGGSLLVDRFGLSPVGRRPFTATRLLGVAVALLAVTLGALQSEGHLRLGLLAAAVAAGAGIALQQAAMGQVAKATGEPLAAAVVNIVLGGLVGAAIWIAATGGTAPGGWSAPPEEWLGGGLCAAGILAVVARVVAVLGVLRLMLTIVAGQSVGALVLDLVVPAPGEHVTVLTVVSVLLTFVAVAAAELGSRRRRTHPA